MLLFDSEYALVTNRYNNIQVFSRFQMILEDIYFQSGIWFAFSGRVVQSVSNINTKTCFS